MRKLSMLEKARLYWTLHPGIWISLLMMVVAMILIPVAVYWPRIDPNDYIGMDRASLIEKMGEPHRVYTTSENEEVIEYDRAFADESGQTRQVRRFALDADGTVVRLIP